MTSVYGETSLSQVSRESLAGYRESQPAQVGNQAFAQFQWDVYGEVLDGLWACVGAGVLFVVQAAWTVVS